MGVFAITASNKPTKFGCIMNKFSCYLTRDIKEQADVEFPRLNVGRMVNSWNELKHPNKINANSAGIEHRKFFDYAK
jgi:hypothetical protein